MRAIRFELVPGEGLRLTASSTETVEALQLIPTEYQGDQIMIGFNATFVLDWLRTVNGHGAKLSLRDFQSAGLWEPAELKEELAGYTYKTVIMPMRV